MVLQKDINHYALRMRMYASMLHDLAGSEEYITRLIENNDLDALDGVGFYHTQINRNR